MPAWHEFELLLAALLLANAFMLVYYYRKTIFRRRRGKGRRFGFVFFFPKGCDSRMTPIQAPAGAVSTLPADFAGVVDIVFLEADDSGAVLPGVGPFVTTVADPAGVLKLSDDQKSFTLTGAAGTATVSVEDQGNGIKASANIAVTAVTPPPPTPTQGAVFFVPETAQASSTASASAPATGASVHPPEVKA